MDTRVYRAFEQQVEMGKKGLKVLEDWENMTAEQKAELYPHASDYAAMVEGSRRIRRKARQRTR